MNDLNTDYGYCTSLLDGEKECPLRDGCRRYLQAALTIDAPLWWTDGFYNEKTNTCDFIDEKANNNDR